MGSGFSHLIPCFKPPPLPDNHRQKDAGAGGAGGGDIIFTADQPLDETLGHSFCYVRSSNRFVSPTASDRFLSPTHSLRFDASAGAGDRSAPETTAFRSISGASVSANTSTPRTLNYDGGEYGGAGGYSGIDNGGGFDCSASFAAIPLQPVPRGEENNNESSSSGFFLSGPIERGALSGPLEPSGTSDVPFSAPLGGAYYKKRRKKSFPGFNFKNKLSRSFSEKKRPWVVPVERKESNEGANLRVKRENEEEEESNSNVQWALGKAGEDRVHVVVSEEHGWLFVGIYDGFNGPDAPEFLMGHLYKAVFHELKGLFWDNEEEGNCCSSSSNPVVVREQENEPKIGANEGKRVTFDESEVQKKEIRRKLWEFLAEDDAEDGLDLSGSDRFAFSVDDAVSVVSNAGSAVSRRSLLLSKLKQGLSRGRDGHGRSFFSWRFGVVEEKEEGDKVDGENRGVEEGERGCSSSSRSSRKRKTGPVDHELVLRAMSQALERTENAYLELTDKVIDRYPELALMGSCLLVVLMRDEDVYVMNVGDSRAIVAQFEPQEGCSNVGGSKEGDSGSSTEEGIVEESGEKSRNVVAGEFHVQGMMKLNALQLSTDHSTSIEEEVLRIKREHPEDNQCIVNDRVKGRLKVTRAFGAGFLKQAKFNDALLEMFRNEFIGDAPYVSCIPSLRHHKLGSRDQFLVLSSDGLYQYLTNEEVVSFVENFMERFPDGDPAQHLIEELLNRAAKKAGMGLHDLLDIPQGDRRKYHDDVTVMVISLEGRIWKSSGKYP